MNKEEKVFDDLHARIFGEVSAVQGYIGTLKTLVKAIKKNPNNTKTSKILQNMEDSLNCASAELEKVTNDLVYSDFNLKRDDEIQRFDNGNE